MKKAVLQRKDFNIYVSDVNYFSHIYGIHNQYEITLEPCDRGFCIALYDKFITRKIIGDRVCTELEGYGDDRFHERVRKDDAWDRALDIANSVIEKRLPKGIERI